MSAGMPSGMRAYRPERGESLIRSRAKRETLGTGRGSRLGAENPRLERTSRSLSAPSRRSISRRAQRGHGLRSADDMQRRDPTYAPGNEGRPAMILDWMLSQSPVLLFVLSLFLLAARGVVRLAQACIARLRRYFQSKARAFSAHP